MTRIQEIEARAEAAMAGPWRCGAGPYGWDDGIVQSDVEVTFSSGVVLTNSGHGGTSLSDDDGDFIAHTRSDIPWLLAELRDSEEKLTAVRRYTTTLWAQLHGPRQREIVKELDLILEGGK